nr:RNA-directed DNA polymerase, eukaryota [Tanacetum cinerariifolium]
MIIPYDHTTDFRPKNMNLLFVNEEEKSLFSTRLYIFSPDIDNEKTKEKLDNVVYDVVIIVAPMLLKRRTYDEKLHEFKFRKASVASKVHEEDDSCLVNKDLVNCVMGEVLQFSSVNNLRVLLSNEGFHNARIVYLGGLWVMIELKSSKTKSKFMQHVGVASWFRRWVDIEGVPLNAWSRSTFQKIASKWGEMVELEDGYDDLFTRKRICIKTSQTKNILESFKIIVKRKVFWARAKELFVWSPSFKEVPEKVICSDDESVKINEEANSLNNGVEESDSDVVSDTFLGDNGEDQGLEHQQGESSNAKEVSSDPFNIYGLLDKRTKEVRTTDTTTSIPYPPGFTPVNEIPASIKQDAPEVESDRPPNRSKRSNSRVLEYVANYVDKSSSESINNEIKLNEGGSILEILEEMITVGQTMGFSIEGCTKDMEKIIRIQGEQVVFR